MLTLIPIPAPGGAFALPLDALASLNLPGGIGRRFPTPQDALAWFLTSPWQQFTSGDSRRDLAALLADAMPEILFP